MSKSICLANDNVMIALDQFAQVYDVYYPHIGLENHTMGHFVHKIGVWVDDSLSWFDNGSWTFDIDYQSKTLVSNIIAHNEELRITIQFQDCVYNEKDIFVRHIKLVNNADYERSIKLFFNQQFQIYESHRGDTALYDHDDNVIIHYKGDRAILINCLTEDGHSFGDYSVGLLGIEGKEGTYKDAETGELSKNNVEHGIVDSVIGVLFIISGQSTKEMDYWMVFERSVHKAKIMNQYVLQRTPADLIESTQGYWHAWITKHEIPEGVIDYKYTEQLEKSLLIIDTHSGGNGVIIASGDSDLLKLGRGTYSYMWPRDGALVVLPLIEARYLNIPRKFFEFCRKIITNEGYLLHKYRADATLGSSWHPWVRDCKSELPIQEDETALVVYALWKYYEESKDLEFIESVYSDLIRKPAEFMLEYSDSITHLPKPTYDLWEEKFGTSTFTCAAVYAAMISAYKFAELLGKDDEAYLYHTFAKRLKDAIVKYLWDDETKCFVKLVNKTMSGMQYDRTIDMSSVHGLIEFEVLTVDDPLIEASILTIEQNLIPHTEIGGVCRYVDDNYFRVSQDVPGNPWVITSLWLARYYLKKASTEQELAPVYYWLDWVLAHKQKSGILSEQINPYSGFQISATPLTWSQAEYVLTTIELIRKVQTIRFNMAENIPDHTIYTYPPT